MCLALADEGLRPDRPTKAGREEIEILRDEYYELHRANEILKGRQHVAQPTVP